MKYPIYAFPSETATGMTLRDWFAGQALVGLFSENVKIGLSDEDLVNNAFEIADMMMGARK